MPVEDGFSLTHKVRQLPPSNGGQIPAIALTAHAGSENHSQALASGFQVHLAKPVDINFLVQIILKTIR